MMDVPAALDRFVHATHLDALTPYAHPRPRSLRWWPLVALVALAVGYALQTGGGRGLWGWRVGVAGSLLFWAAFSAAQIVPLFGPRLIPDGHGALDERELMVRARAGSLSGAVLTILAAIGCFYFGLAPVFGPVFVPAGPLEWTFLGLALLAAARLLPVLVASWLLPRPDGADD
jgi:hypothetical protein